jgi:phosphoglycerol transferase MdoB-like AlkP superfamily enzyme
MILILSFIPLVLVAVWLIAEVRGRLLTRLVAGFAALIALAVVAFLLGAFAEGMRHTVFPVPHDAPSETNTMSR